MNSADAFALSKNGIFLITHRTRLSVVIFSLHSFAFIREMRNEKKKIDDNSQILLSMQNMKRDSFNIANEDDR